MRKIFLFWSIFTLSFTVHAQNPVEIHLSKIDPDLIGQATMDQDEFLKWMESLNDTIDSYFVMDTNNFEVAIMFTLSREEDVHVQIASRPGGNTRNLFELQTNLENIPSPRAKYVPYTFMLIARMNEGCANDHQFQPEFDYHSEQRIETFEKLDLDQQRQALYAYADKEVLPMIQFYASAVDSSFKGVRGFANLLEGWKERSWTVAQFTELNEVYWEAVLEMSPGYQLIPFAKACLHILYGEYNKAVRLLKLISLFSNEDSLPFALYNDLNSRLSSFLIKLKRSVDELAAHRRKEGSEGTSEKITALRTQYPNYPHAVLEYHLTHMGSKVKKSHKTAVNEELNRCDLLFYPRLFSINAEEGYRNSKCKEVSALYSNPDSVKTDVVKFADAALDVQDYSLAAQTYWLILNFLNKDTDYNNRDILAHFLYCLNKLGHTEILSKFKGDFGPKFEKIESERSQLMKDSAAYKNWKKSK